MVIEICNWEAEVTETCYLHELCEIMGEWTREEPRESDCQRHTLGQLMKNHLMRVGCFHKFLKFSLRDDTRVRFCVFWHNPWCGVSCATNRLPYLFQLEVDMNATIASYLNGEQSWNPLFCRSFQDGELEAVDSLVYLLYSHSPQGQAEDQAL